MCHEGDSELKTTAVPSPSLAPRRPARQDQCARAQETEADTVTPLLNSAHCPPHFQWCGGRRFSPTEMPIDQALFIRMEGGGRQHPRCKEVPGPLTPVSPRPPRSQHRETAVILGGCRNTQKKHAQGENRSLTFRNGGVNSQNKKRKGDSALAPLGMKLTVG